MSRIKKSVEYLKYLSCSLKHKRTKSEYIKDFIRNCIRADKRAYEFSDIEMHRKEMLDSEEVIKVTDYGQGSKKHTLKGKTGEYPRIYFRKLSELAKYSLKSKKECQLIAAIIDYYKPSEILELGTALGITTSYMAKTNPPASIITVEGCPEIAAKAAENFEKLNVKNIRLINGSFDNALSDFSATRKRFDIIFIDGDHDYTPLMTNFSKLTDKISDRGIMIVDDIRWSGGMIKAWEEMKNHVGVSASIDIFDKGILFFNKNIEKQHLMIWY
ncbi:MAG: class I SAM-dependent methyltransferase [Bacteroidales bacterium]